MDSRGFSLQNIRKNRFQCSSRDFGVQFFEIQVAKIFRRLWLVVASDTPRVIVFVDNLRYEGIAVLGVATQRFLDLI